MNYYDKTLKICDDLSIDLLNKLKNLDSSQTVSEYLRAQEYHKDRVIPYPDWEKYLLKYLKKGDSILDFGCGFGHSSEIFINNDYKVTAVDGSKNACEIASLRLNIPVRQMRFDELDDIDIYNAIWANVSLLHVPGSEQGKIYSKMVRALKVGGYLYASYKEGTYDGYRTYKSMPKDDEQPKIMENYFKDFTEESYKSFLKNFDELMLIDIHRTAYQLKDDENWIHFIVRKK